MTRYLLVLPALIAISLGCLSGCDEGSAGVSLQGSEYLLSEEPTGAIGITEAKSTLQDAEGEQEIVVMGRIGAGEATPWEEGQASFMFTEPAELTSDTVHDHGGEGHDPTTCPYCSKGKSITDLVGIVQILGDDGKVIPIDAREFLGVEAKQLVVVKGKASIDSLGYLVVSADGIYVRK